MRVAVRHVVDYEVVARLAERLPRRLQLIHDESDRVGAERLAEECDVHRLKTAASHPDALLYASVLVEHPVSDRERLFDFNE